MDAEVSEDSVCRSLEFSDDCRGGQQERDDDRLALHPLRRIQQGVQISFVMGRHRFAAVGTVLRISFPGIPGQALLARLRCRIRLILQADRHIPVPAIVRIFLAKSVPDFGLRMQTSAKSASSGLSVTLKYFAAISRLRGYSSVSGVGLPNQSFLAACTAAEYRPCCQA